MSDPNRSLVAHLAARIAAVLCERYAVVAGGRCQPIDGLPQYVVTFDVMVVRAEAEWLTSVSGAILSPRTPPVSAIDVVTPRTLTECLADKPDLLNVGGLSEYVVYDPTADVLRPRLQAHRRIDGGYRPVRSALSGVLFARPRFALDARGPEVLVSACGPPDAEEGLFALRAVRAGLAERTDGRAAGELARLDGEIRGAEARLARYAGQDEA